MNIVKIKEIFVKIIFYALLTTIIGTIASVFILPISTYLLVLKLQRDVILSTPLDVTDFKSATHFLNTIYGMQSWYIGYFALNLLLIIMSLKSKFKYVTLFLLSFTSLALGLLLFIIRKNALCINYILETCKSKGIELSIYTIKQAKYILFYIDAWEIILGIILIAIISGVIAAIITPNFND